MCLKGVHKLVSLDAPVLYQAAFCSHKEVRLVDLVQVRGPPLILECLNNVLPPRLQVDDCEQYLTLVVV